ncbi:hypothetical protein [Sphingosinicella sp. BN140058]|uniref:hypothetical protein n=1 Tax=Sphingosinicella sp. BN140058 TaxID=1892855 RepID=UPI001010334D|nr:hypothetical protein [Sphingosinicella sp. BN140058]QAY78268.1 hypothetical protein ETR14_18305 [Sphingosinicella sp. BN140058]
MKIAIALFILALMILPAVARIRIKLDRGRRAPRVQDGSEVLPARREGDRLQDGGGGSETH